MRQFVRKHGAIIGYLILCGAVGLCIGEVLVVALEGRKSHDAVCALRADLIRRVGDTEAFLKTHPNGIPKAGISRADLERNLKGQRDTIHALRGADC